ncbi:hypothetical protein HMPREF9123_0310 [Neisseria bacilliformis ATCC BAA-1200]|uniref:Uncharacterized protein n=1 Tax=Neisseria bacilliformis ATCC BAA-1200 TaxID=888742 RepID=F2B9A7_9NEIS|nr:hypothetical protein HMPREF9123_0310 [Neisseria bacilliformis ATCC BAA-1200]
MHGGRGRKKRADCIGKRGRREGGSGAIFCGRGGRGRLKKTKKAV